MVFILYHLKGEKAKGVPNVEKEKLGCIWDLFSLLHPVLYNNKYMCIYVQDFIVLYPFSFCHLHTQCDIKIISPSVHPPHLYQLVQLGTASDIALKQYMWTEVH